MHGIKQLVCSLAAFIVTRVFDPKDIQALFISFGLTLWDALPVFLIVGASSAVVARTLFQPARFSAIWVRRRLVALGGIAYLALLQSELVFSLAAMLATAVAFTFLAHRSISRLPVAIAQVSRFATRLPCNLNTVGELPSSELRSAKLIISELFGLVLLASVVAAFLKVYGSNFQLGSEMWILIAIVAGLITGLPPGVAAVPALTITSVSGSFTAGLIWIILATVIETLRVIPSVYAGSSLGLELPEPIHQPSEDQSDCD